MRENSNIKVEIESLLNHIALPDSLKTEVIDYKFSFGPLPDGKYKIKAFLIDSSTKIVYRGYESVDVNSPDSIENILIDLAATGEMQYASGTVYLIDPLNQMTKQPSDNVVMTFISNNPISVLPNKGIATLKNDSYFYGPLLPGSYKIRIRDKDNSQLSYKINEDIVLEGNSPVQTFAFKVPWNQSTAVQIITTDALGNELRNSRVYLYNNYEFLVKYQANAEASVRNGTSNDDGLISFENLTTVPHFVYAEKIIGTDTLTSLTSNFDASSVDALVG